MKFVRNLCLLLFASFVFTACNEKPKVVENEAIMMAKAVAGKLDAISAELDAITDFESIRKSEVVIKQLSEDILQLYKDNKGLKTDQATVEKINSIVAPAGKRLEKARTDARARFKDNLPVKNALLVSLNVLAAKFDEIKKINEDSAEGSTEGSTEE